jgi:hypothetical protein
MTYIIKMRKITLDIPDALDKAIVVYLAYSDLELRDKGRMILYAIENLMREDAPAELKERCKLAKDAIREKQKKRYQEMKA